MKRLWVHLCLGIQGDKKGCEQKNGSVDKIEKSTYNCTKKKAVKRKPVKVYFQFFDWLLFKLE